MEYPSERPTDMSRERLIQELEDTREQLKKQKTLKEMFINKGKETTRELELLRKYSDDVTLSKAKIAAQVRDETKRRNKKDLHVDYEELKVAYLINEEKFRAALQEEKDKNKLLQEELEQISASHNEIRLSYEADVTEVRQPVETLQDKFTAELHAEQQKNKLLQDKLDSISQEYESEFITLRQRAKSLQRELEEEVEALADRMSRDLQVITNLKAEQDHLRHRMTQEIDNLQQNTLEEERYKRQLEELKAQLAVQTSFNLELSAKLKASKACEQDSIAAAPELLDVTEVSEETHQGKPKSPPGKEPVTYWD